MERLFDRTIQRLPFLGTTTLKAPETMPARQQHQSLYICGCDGQYALVGCADENRHSGQSRRTAASVRFRTSTLIPGSMPIFRFVYSVMIDI